MCYMLYQKLNNKDVVKFKERVQYTKEQVISVKSDYINSLITIN